MTKQETIEALVRLYRLRDEGKRVAVKIAELEALLFELLDYELDQREEEEDGDKRTSPSEG